MKKIKLLTNIIAGGALLSATPIITTSCNGSDKTDALAIRYINWDKAPANGVTSALQGIIINDNHGNALNFVSTPIKTIEDNGSDEKLGVKTSKASLTIKPSKIGEYKLKLNITAYKDTNKEEVGETYSVETTVKVLTAINFSLDVEDADNVESYEDGLLTISSKTVATTIKLVANPAPSIMSVVFSIWFDDELVEIVPTWESLNSWNIAIPANTVSSSDESTIKITASGDDENQAFQVFTFKIIAKA